MRIKINKLIKHIKKWNKWRKHSLNSPISKLLVLFNIIKSPTFEHFWTEQDARAFREGFLQGMREAADEQQNNGDD